MSKKPVILVVDDEPAIRDSIKILLKDNYQLLCSKCLLEGKYSYDIIEEFE